MSICLNISTIKYISGILNRILIRYFVLKALEIKLMITVLNVKKMLQSTIHTTFTKFLAVKFIINNFIYMHNQELTIIGGIALAINTSFILANKSSFR